VGACLAGAGTLYQALFRNPLADPYILGVSSGAGLGATIALVAGAAGVVGSAVAVPAAAFVGAVAFSRTGDTDTGVFDDAVVLKQFGDVPTDLTM
jgi:iron complex transport system permease protein